MSEKSNRFPIIACVVAALVGLTLWIALGLTESNTPTVTQSRSVTSSDAQPTKKPSSDSTDRTGSTAVESGQNIAANSAQTARNQTAESQLNSAQTNAPSTADPENSTDPQNTVASVDQPASLNDSVTLSDPGIGAGDNALFNDQSPTIQTPDTFEAESNERAREPDSAVEQNDSDPDDNETENRSIEETRDEGADEKATHSIAGVVQTSQGQVVPGISVSAQRMDGRGAGSRNLISDEQGRFSFTGLPPGDYRLQTPPTANYTSQTIYAQAGLQSASIVVQGIRQAKAAGIVRNSQGDVLSNVNVQPPYPGQATRTDADGRYQVSFQGKENQGFVLQFRADNYVDEILHIAASDWKSNELIERDVVLRGRGNVSVTGNVTDDSLLPLEGALVQLSSKTVDTHQHTLTDKEGNYVIDGVIAADDYVIKFSATNGYVEHRQENVVVRNTIAMNATLIKVSNGRIAGTITDIEGAPLPNFTLLVVSSDANGRSDVITSDDYGGFEVASVASGKLTFLSRSEPSIRVDGPTLPEGGDIVVNLVIDWGPLELAGVVTDESTGNPIKGAEITMTWQHGYADGRSVVTRRHIANAQGGYRFTELGPGGRQLYITAKDYHPKQVTVNPRELPNFPIKLKPK